MREFDLGSDADLNFVIPDADADEQVYWTGVAERMIQTLRSYTGEGVMFAIDTRLRPNGRAGDLVQTESAYKTYFAHGAEAWEGISYMKARAMAGNLDRATGSCTSCRTWTGGATGRACGRAANCERCARAWSGSRARAIR